MDYVSGWLFDIFFDFILPGISWDDDRSPLTVYFSVMLKPPTSISILYIYKSGWWFGTFFSPYIGNNHPN